jgi:hypothetical protein
MNSNTSVSTTRKIDGIYIAVNVTASLYSADGESVKLAEQSAAVAKFIAGLPGEPVPEYYGGAPSAGAPTPATPDDLIDPPTTDGASVETPVATEEPSAIAAV